MCEILRKFDIDSLYICPPFLYTVTNWLIFDRVIGKIKGGRFFGDSVYLIHISAFHSQLITVQFSRCQVCYNFNVVNYDVLCVSHSLLIEALILTRVFRMRYCYRNSVRSSVRHTGNRHLDGSRYRYTCRKI